MTERETLAWEMRSRGHTLEEIAKVLECSITNVHLILKALNERALERNAGNRESQKVEQTQILWHTLSQAMRAWEASKEPLHRVTQDADGNTQTTVIRREGNTTYLNAVFKALADIRSLWGLDIAPQVLEPIQGIAQLAEDMKRRADAIINAREAEKPASDDPGSVPPGAGSGTGGVPA